MTEVESKATPIVRVSSHSPDQMVDQHDGGGTNDSQAEQRHTAELIDLVDRVSSVVFRRLSGTMNLGLIGVRVQNLVRRRDRVSTRVNTRAHKHLLSGQRDNSRRAIEIKDRDETRDRRNLDGERAEAFELDCRRNSLAKRVGPVSVFLSPQALKGRLHSISIIAGS